jgi:hypothetical protein
MNTLTVHLGYAPAAATAAVASPDEIVLSAFDLDVVVDRVLQDIESMPATPTPPSAGATTTIAGASVGVPASPRHPRFARERERVSAHRACVRIDLPVAPSHHGRAVDPHERVARVEQFVEEPERWDGLS